MFDKLEIKPEHTDFDDISEISYKDLVSAIEKEEIKNYKPEHICKFDPRNSQRIVYSLTRARRPHDNKPLKINGENKSCVVCEGKTTKIIDKASLSEGFTFINKNLFPMIYPEGYLRGEKYHEGGMDFKGDFAFGLHLLQWSSNYHDRDISNMSLEDVHIVMKRLAAIEKKLLHSEDSLMPSTLPYEKEEHFGYVGIIKNYGHLVGGSLLHGHQQIIHTNIMPGKIKDDLTFRKNYNKSFSDFILENNPSHLTLEDMESLRIIVPYFMKRPLDSMIILKDSSKTYLHHLSDTELYDLGKALQFVLLRIPPLMISLGKEPAYNVIFHNGPSGGFYVEILPYTQETGGYEHLGIYICQGSPEDTVEIYKKFRGDVGIEPPSCC